MYVVISDFLLQHMFYHEEFADNQRTELESKFIHDFDPAYLQSGSCPCREIISPSL